jgi:hypothetical protein
MGRPHPTPAGQAEADVINSKNRASGTFSSPSIIAAQMSTKGAGGTAGGVGQFFLGLAMAVAGAYLITNQVTVSSGFWGYFGPHTFGLTLLPLVFGIGMLFFDGRSVIGWVLTVGGAVIIFVGILVNLQVYFRPTSLYNTIVMLVLLAGGIGLVARSLRPYSD